MSVIASARRAMKSDWCMLSPRGMDSWRFRQAPILARKVSNGVLSRFSVHRDNVRTPTHRPPMRSILLGITLCAIALPAAAAESARTRMEAFASGLASVSGSFSQGVTDANGHRGDASQGRFALQAPRQFRWETLQPYQQTIVADGRRVWVYEPDLEQVSVRSQGVAEAQSPLTVLTDLSQLDRQYTAT